MSRVKTSTKSASVKKDPESESGKSVIRETVPNIRIVFQGTCPKLTNRGRGDLSYELGIDDSAGESYLRISANVSSGAFSNEWLALSKLRSLLESAVNQQKAFSAKVIESLFTRRSANNCGYLAAALKAEGVLSVLPGKPVVLGLEGWDAVTEKISSLGEQGIHLTDHIALAAQKRADEKAQRLASLNESRSTKSTAPVDMSTGEDDQLRADKQEISQDNQ